MAGESAPSDWNYLPAPCFEGSLGFANASVPRRRKGDPRRERTPARLEKQLAAFSGGGMAGTNGVSEDGFSVEDDGLGISEDERADVSVVGYSTSEAGTGFGLRLA